MINYSIIIPHKNIPNLLQRCLDSIPIRDDTQVIVVDDDSNSELVDFSNFPGVDQPNVEIVYLKEGKGAGYARNVGISKAVGKWVLFADADDFFTYCFNDLLDFYKDDICDVVFFNASSVDSDTYMNTSRAGHINNAHLLNDTDNNKEYFFRYLFGEPWCKFVKRELLQKKCIKCEETPIHNDTQLSYQIGYYSKKIKYDKHCIYCVTSRTASVSKQVGDEILITRLNVFCRKYAYLRDRGIDVFEDYFIIPVFLHYINSKEEDKLNQCYDIAKGYGLSRDIIDDRIRQNLKMQKRNTLRLKLKKIIKGSVNSLLNE